MQRRPEGEVVHLCELVVDPSTKSFSTAVTDRARVAASEPDTSSSNGSTLRSNKGITTPSHSAR